MTPDASAANKSKVIIGVDDTQLISRIGHWTRQRAGKV